MTAGAPSAAPEAPADAGPAAWLYRRQLVLAAVAGAVVLVAVAAVTLAVPDPVTAPEATLRVAADGRVVPVPALSGASRTALWAAGLALVAVAVVLTLVLDHMWRVTRFAVLGHGVGPAGRPRGAPQGATDQEIRDRWQ